MLRTGFYYPAPGREGKRRPTEAELRELWGERKEEVIEAWAALGWSAEESWAERAFDQGDAAALKRLEWRRRPGTDT